MSMTREEEIDKAAKRCVNNCTELSNRYSIDENDLEDFFVEGAEWADKNPQSPWISDMEDLPCNHEELLDSDSYNNETIIVLTTCGNNYFLNWMELGRNGEWVWHNVKNVTHWMRLPELPKE